MNYDLGKNVSNKQNSWVKEKLTSNEAKALLNIGTLIKFPFNHDLIQLKIVGHHLIRLDLRKQDLTFIPDCIRNFSHLKELILKNNNLESLPESLGKLTQLEYLDLDSNLVSAFPDSICNLINLKEIWARENRLKSLPNSIGELKNLKKLSVANNLIISIPGSLTHLNKLEFLDLRNNPMKSMTPLDPKFSKVNIKIGQLRDFDVSLGHKRSINTFKERKHPPEIDLIRILKPQYYQIYVLGSKTVGKSSLLNRRFKNVFYKRTVFDNNPKVVKHKITDIELYTGVNRKFLTVGIKDISDEERKSEKKELMTLRKIIQLEVAQENSFEFWESDHEKLLTQIEMAYIEGCNGIILCVDLSDQEDVNEFLSTMEGFFSIIDRGLNIQVKNIPILIVGTKEDKINTQVESSIYSVCRKMLKRRMNLILFHDEKELSFFNDWNKPEQFDFQYDLKMYLKTSAKQDKNISLAIKLIETATKEQMRAIDLINAFSVREIDYEKRPFEKPPYPFIFYFPYPKGPPAASGQKQRKTSSCKSCGNPIEFHIEKCPKCGYVQE